MTEATDAREKVGFLKVNGKNHALYQGLNLIGRNKGATVILKHTSISHQHSIITALDSGKFYISDFNSSNGTYLKHKKLKPLHIYEIENQTCIKFANIDAVFFELPKAKGDISLAIPSSEPILSQCTQSNILAGITQVLTDSQLSTQSYTKSWGDSLDFIQSQNAYNASINDIPTQIMSYTSTLQSPVRHTEDQGINVDIHDQPTQIICPDKGLNAHATDNIKSGKSISDSFKNANCINKSPTNKKLSNKKETSSQKSSSQDVMTQCSYSKNNSTSEQHGKSCKDVTVETDKDITSQRNSLVDPKTQFFNSLLSKVSNKQCHRTSFGNISIGTETDDDIGKKDLEINDVVEDTFSNNFTTSNNTSRVSTPFEPVKTNSPTSNINTDLNSLQKELYERLNSPNTNDSDLESQSKLHVSQLKTRNRSHIISDESDMETDNFKTAVNSLDSDSQSRLQMSQLRKKRYKQTISDDSEESFDVDFMPNITCSNKKKALKSILDDDTEIDTGTTSKEKKVLKTATDDSSSETDVEDILKPKSSFDQNIEEALCRSQSEGALKEKKTVHFMECHDSESETDIEKNDHNVDSFKLHRRGFSSLNDSDVIPGSQMITNSLINKDRNESSANTETSQGSFKLALSHTQESTKLSQFEEVVSDQDDYIFQKPTQKLEGSSYQNDVWSRSTVRDEDTDKLKDVQDSNSVTEQTTFENYAEKLLQKSSYSSKSQSDYKNPKIIARSTRSLPESSNSPDKTDNDNLFFIPTQKMTTDEEIVGQSKKKSLFSQEVHDKEDKFKINDSDDNENLFLMPTQKLIESADEQTNKISNETNNEEKNLFLETADNIGENTAERSTKDISEQHLQRVDNIFMQVIEEIDLIQKLNESKESGLATALEDSDLSVNQKMGVETDNNDKDIFLEPTQKMSTEETCQSKEEKGIKNDAEDIFLEPTQNIDTEETFQTDIAKTVGNNEKDIFLEPTQIINTIEIIQQSVSKRVENNEKDIFLEPTQKMNTEEASQIEQNLMNIAEIVNNNKDIILELSRQLAEKETQPQDVQNKACVDDIFLQPTQEIKQNDNDKLLENLNEELESKRTEQNNAGDSIFTNETQRVNINTDSNNLHKESSDVKQTTTCKTAETTSDLHTVESQLEVMFATQTPEVHSQDGRPINPLANIFQDDNENTETYISFDVDRTEGIKNEKADKDNNCISGNKVTGLSIKKLKDINTKKNVEISKTIAKEKADKRKSSNSNDTSKEKRPKRRGTSNVEVTLENKRITTKTFTEPKTGIKRARASTRSVSNDTISKSEKTPGKRSMRSSVSNKKVTEKQAGTRSKGECSPQHIDIAMHVENERKADSKRESRSSKSEAKKNKDKEQTTAKNKNAAQETKVAVLDFSIESDFMTGDFEDPKVGKKVQNKIVNLGETEQKRKRKSKRLNTTITATSPSQKRKANDDAPTTPKTRKSSGLALLSSEQKKLKPKVVFTMLDSPELQTLVRRYGGTVVDTVDAATVLVTGSLKRSLKLLSAVGMGKPVCSVKWLEDSREANEFLDPWQYILHDEEGEKKWNLSLKESLERSKSKRLLEGHTFYLCVSSAADVVKGAVESCGGKCIARAPTRPSKNIFIVVASPDNVAKCKKFVEQVPPVPVVAPEAIFDGVLRQELQLEKHLLI